MAKNSFVAVVTLKLVIYQPLASSKWAATIVPVLKGNSNIWIWHYYETVNNATNWDKYHIPKTEDIFATFKGGIHKTRFESSLSVVKWTTSLV